MNGSGKPASGAKKTVRIAPIVVESWNRTNFRMLSYSVRPLSHRADDGGEVVVGQHHGGGLFGHRRAADPHRHADVACLKRGRIVDAVAGHGHDVSLGCRARTILTLCEAVTRANTATSSIDAANCAASMRSMSAPETARPCRPSSAAMADGRRLVVAGDHLDGDARLAALGDRLLRFGPWRVHQPDQPDEVQLGDAGREIAGRVELCGWQGARCDQQPTQTALAEGAIVRIDLGCLGRTEGGSTPPRRSACSAPAAHRARP